MKHLIKGALNRLGYEIVAKEVLRNSVQRSIGVQEELRWTVSNFESLCRAVEADRALELSDNREKRFSILRRLMGTPASEAYQILDGITRTRNVAGDICEFGVAQGETSALIASEARDLTDKRFHLFDSFAGLPKPTEKDRLIDDIFGLGSMEAYESTMACPESMVLARLEAVDFPKDRYVVHKGFMEDLVELRKNFPEKVSFAYVDFDFYEPIKIALEYLKTVLSPGAIVIVDDYDFFSTGVKEAVDEFVCSENHTTKTFSLSVPDKAYGCYCIIEKYVR